METCHREEKVVWQPQLDVAAGIPLDMKTNTNVHPRVCQVLDGVAAKQVCVFFLKTGHAEDVF